MRVDEWELEEEIEEGESDEGNLIIINSNNELKREEIVNPRKEKGRWWKRERVIYWSEKGVCGVEEKKKKVVMIIGIE